MNGALGTGMRAHALSVRGVTHRYATTVALDDVSLDFPAGELVALLGPSGCGKTTLLRSIAGFVRPERGEIVIDGEVIDALAPGQRGVGIVFQSYALFPHMTVAENVGYGLKARGMARSDLERRVNEMLALVRLDEYRDRMPRALSGGQQQRVALARVIAVEPRILLLDEPFSALDRNLRLDMQIEIKRLQRSLGVTAVMVTHDQDEAMSMADHIAVMNQGRIHQYAPPVELYDEPADLFVSQFIGSTNLIPATVASAQGGTTAVTFEAGGTLELRDARGLAAGSRVWASVRPENLEVAPASAPGSIAVRLVVAMPIGPDALVEAEAGDGLLLKSLSRRGRGAHLPAPGTPVHLHVADPGAVRLFPR